MAQKVMSLLAQFDDICRGFSYWTNDPYREFEAFARNQEDCRRKWFSIEERCSIVQQELHESKANREKLELQVRHVTELLRNEIHIRQRLQKEEKDLERKLNMVKQIVSSDRNIAVETRDKLVSVSSIESYGRSDLESPSDHLIDTTSEAELSAHSIVSSFDVTGDKTDEDLELSIMRSVREVRTRAPPVVFEVPVVPGSSAKEGKDPQSKYHMTLVNQTVVTPLMALPTVHITSPLSGGGNLGARSSQSPPIESDTPKGEELNKGCLTEPEHQIGSRSYVSGFPLSASRAVRQHNFASKVILKQESCTVCKNRIRFGKSAMKCVDCLMTCHAECKSTILMPCVPMVRPTHLVGSIADFSSKTSPMIPALLVHCLEEIELRGLEEVGIYRVSAPEREVHALKEKLLHGKVRVGQMNDVSVHVIAGVVRSFLHSLKEPLVTYTSRESFIKIAYIQDETDVQMTVCALVPELPQPNRDTLAYLILHLQRVAESLTGSRPCFAAISNLAKTFAPVVIGSAQCSPKDGLMKLQDMKEQQITMEKLMNVTSDYWSRYGKYQGTDAITPFYNVRRNLRKTNFFTSPHF